MAQPVTWGRYWATILLLLLTIPAVTGILRTDTKPWKPPIHGADPVFGFDLGQSYATAVMRLPNGTVRPVAKIQGGAAYYAIMENLMREETSKPEPTFYRRAFGFPETASRIIASIENKQPPASRLEVGVLADMIRALKVASETVTNTKIRAAAISTPWMRAWDKKGDDNPLQEALRLAGIEWYWCLSEAAATLASEDVATCKPVWCQGMLRKYFHPGSLQEKRRPGPKFFIGFTNQSLYTTFETGECYFHMTTTDAFASINPRYGFDRADEGDTADRFWVDLKKYLLDQYKTRLNAHYRAPHRKTYWKHRSPTTVIVAGEASHHPRFLKVVRDVIDELPRIRSYYKHVDEKGPAWFVLANDPTYAAAKGAMSWLESSLKGETYCRDPEQRLKSSQVLETFMRGVTGTGMSVWNPDRMSPQMLLHSLL